MLKVFTVDRKQCSHSMSKTKISRKKDDLLLNLSLAFYLSHNRGVRIYDRYMAR
jgi:hypothetical protein